MALLHGILMMINLKPDLKCLWCSKSIHWTFSTIIFLISSQPHMKRTKA